MHHDPQRHPDPHTFKVSYSSPKIDSRLILAPKNSRTGSSTTLPCHRNLRTWPIPWSETTGCSASGASFTHTISFICILIFFFLCSRRICPGMWVAEREVFLAIARMLWAFKMDEIPDEPIDIKEYDGLSGRSPVPFRIKITPRHDQVETVLGL